MSVRLVKGTPEPSGSQVVETSRFPPQTERPIGSGAHTPLSQIGLTRDNASIGLAWVVRPAPLGLGIRRAVAD